MPPMLSFEQVARAEQRAKQWIESWNSHDLEAILAHYADSLEFTSPLIAKLTGLTNGTIYQKADLRAYFARGLAAYPDLQFELIQVLTGVNSLVIVYHSVNGLQAAEFMNLDNNGLIRRVVAHYSE